MAFKKNILPRWERFYERLLRASLQMVENLFSLPLEPLFCFS